MLGLWYFCGFLYLQWCCLRCFGLLSSCGNLRCRGSFCRFRLCLGLVRRVVIWVFGVIDLDIAECLT